MWKTDRAECILRCAELSCLLTAKKQQSYPAKSHNDPKYTLKVALEFLMVRKWNILKLLGQSRCLNLIKLCFTHWRQNKIQNHKQTVTKDRCSNGLANVMKDEIHSLVMSVSSRLQPAISCRRVRKIITTIFQLWHLHLTVFSLLWWYLFSYMNHNFAVELQCLF